jgi:DNA-binding NarL/FixJ family response regulator
LLATKFQAVVMVADGLSLMESAERLRPGLAVVDIALAGGDVLGLIRRLRERCPGLKVILLSVHDEPTVAESVLDAGADSFLVKSALASQLLPAVEAVLRGERYVSSARSARKANDE